MNLKNLLSSILSPHDYNKEEQRLLKEKIITANMIMLFFGVILFSFSILRYTQQHYIQAVVDVILLIFIVISFILLYKNKNHLLLISRILIFFATLTSTTLV